MTAETRGDGRVRRRLALASLSVILFLVSLALPALRFVVSTGEDRVMLGWELVLLGWVACVHNNNLGWLANLVYLPSVVVMVAGLRRLSVGLALVAMLFGLHSLALLGVTFDADEAGVKHMALSHVDAGFYLWMAAMAVVVPGALWGTLPTNRTRRSG
jgi:hypothetical protein